MRVIIVEDMLLLRQGLARILAERGVEVVAERASALNLSQVITAHQPDVVVLDIRMPPTFTDEGLSAAAAIRRDHPLVGVLVLSQYLETVFALRLLETAPERIGYLLKDRVMDIGTVVDALHRIKGGETVIDPTIVSKLLGRQRRPGALNLLTAREHEVLALVAEGLSNQAIAERLRITDRTIETHTGQIFEKLGLDVSSSTHRRVIAALTYLRASG